MMYDDAMERLRVSIQEMCTKSTSQPKSRISRRPSF